MQFRETVHQARFKKNLGISNIQNCLKYIIRYNNLLSIVPTIPTDEIGTLFNDLILVVYKTTISGLWDKYCVPDIRHW